MKKEKADNRPIVRIPISKQRIRNLWKFWVAHKEEFDMNCNDYNDCPINEFFKELVERGK